MENTCTTIISASIIFNGGFTVRITDITLEKAIELAKTLMIKHSFSTIDIIDDSTGEVLTQIKAD